MSLSELHVLEVHRGAGSVQYVPVLALPQPQETSPHLHDPPRPSPGIDHVTECHPPKIFGRRVPKLLLLKECAVPPSPPPPSSLRPPLPLLLLPYCSFYSFPSSSSAISFLSLSGGGLVPDFHAGLRRARVRLRRQLSGQLNDR